MKGAVKDAAGAMTGNERLEREGERENAQGRMRQAENDAVRAPGTPRTWDSSWSNEHLVTGLYDEPEHARKAYHELTTRHGYKDDDISVVMTDETRKRHFGDVQARHRVQGRHEGGRGRRASAAASAWASAPRSAPSSPRQRRSPFLASACSSPDRSRARSPAPGAGGATGTLLGALDRRRHS